MTLKMPGRLRPATRRANRGEAAEASTTAIGSQAPSQTARPPTRTRFFDWAVPGVPAIAALAITLWGAASPSYWRDEAVTLSAAGRPVPDIFRLLSHIDAVHGAYYVLMHFVVAALGIGETATRLPSALAAVAAAAMTALLGRRLAGPRVGAAAGLMVAGAPTISRFAQEARQYTFVTALAVVATYLLVRVIEGGARRRDLTVYAVALTLLGYLHLLALLLIAAHAVTLWSVRPDRSLLRRWALAVACAVAAVVPLAIVALPQRSQVDWIPRPGVRDVTDLAGFLSGTTWLVVPVVLLIVLDLAVGRRGRPPGEVSGRVDLRRLALPWMLLPPALLLGISLIRPYYLSRYVLFCLPAVALLTAAGLCRLRWWAALPAAVVMVMTAVPAHEEIRRHDARADDLRAMTAAIRHNARPGDAIVFHHTLYRRVMAAYPDTYRPLHDVALQTGPAAAGNLFGLEVSSAELAQRLQAVDRVWFVDNRVSYKLPEMLTDRAKSTMVQKSDGFCKIKRWHYRGGNLYLYGRCR